LLLLLLLLLLSTTMPSTTPVLRVPLLFFILVCAGTVHGAVTKISPCKKPLMALDRAVAIEVPRTNFFLLASPKAGAQLTWRLMIDHVNRTAEALTFPNFPFEWMAKIFPQDFPGLRPSPKKINEGLHQGRTAIAFVRNPLDRAISSYMHVMGTILWSKWTSANNQLEEAVASCKDYHQRPDCARNVTFVEFENALTHYAFDGASRYGGDGHMTSQVQFFHLLPKTPGVKIIPIEMMVSEGAGDRCPPLAEFVEVMDPFRLNEREEAINDMLTKGTQRSGTPVRRGYKRILQDKDLSLPDSSHTPFPELFAAVEAGRFPLYDSFFKDKDLCRHVVGCLYARDVAQYLQVCRQPQFHECSFFQKTCREQIRRLRDVCGLEDLVEEFV